MRRNLRVGSRSEVDWRRGSEDVDIRVTISPITDSDRALPLPTLVEALTQNYGRGRGILTHVSSVQRVDFGDHEGLVVYAHRKASLVDRQMAQAFVRAGHHLVMVTYIAPPEVFDTYAPEFAYVCERFRVLLPADRAAMGIPLPSDLPRRGAADGDRGPLPVNTPVAPSTP
jgi:hypothetical protein